MARYIDADELYKATQKRIAEANEARMAVVDDEFLDLINDAFTEDVAPRAEVAREIFEEIEKIIKEANEKVAQLSKAYGLEVDPTSKIKDITVSVQQRVEILKMLYRDAEIYIVKKTKHRVGHEHNMLTTLEVSQKVTRVEYETAS